MPTDISKLGEFGLIDLISKDIKSYQKSTIKGIGDDAAVIEKDDKTFTVVSTDMLLEGIHFDLSYYPLKHLGYKAIVVNLSDIAAMNAVPTHVTVSIALSSRFSVEAVEELYKGMKIACEQYNVDLVGGDTTSSKSGLAISVTAFGEVEKEEIAYRNTASEGEIICVTGDLGGAFIGLQILEREKQVFLSNPEMQPELKDQEYVVMRQLKPEARTDIIHEFREHGITPTSMIDISDGLASELIHICKGSNLGAVLYEDKLPIERNTYEVVTEMPNLSPLTSALNGGEDYELLFTVKVEDKDKLTKLADVSMIGYTRKVKEGLTLISRGGQEIEITAQGWNHFNNQ